VEITAQQRKEAAKLGGPENIQQRIRGEIEGSYPPYARRTTSTELNYIDI
jgi:hypothetical protein